jgi:hypothetical protein
MEICNQMAVTVIQGIDFFYSRSKRWISDGTLAKRIELQPPPHL